MDPLFTPRAIGFARTPFRETSEIPKGPGAKHDATGTLEIAPELEAGLTDIEGFSHLYVHWIFDRAAGFDLLAQPPTADRPHGIFSTRAPRRAPRGARRTARTSPIALRHRHGTRG